ncbi:beta-glucosidase [Obba rivulosa]|uniref:beta-glucosidase n=1 Tax=Obba rivulosa TaxID=1052685 RepID=A0A8E2ATI4_9APHY|nr:beta-glucosidase [Obba rivulosa]
MPRRVPQAGRNWEGFGADPFLAGAAAYETVLGMQSAGVQATAKHFINNEQEYKRTQESSDVDDRTEHEVYLVPFLHAVRAGVAAVMCSYNLVNDTYACENNRTLNQVLKGELGHRGFIMTDWSAQHSTLSAVAGLDMSMPGDITYGSGTSWWGPNLTAFVENATIPESRLDDMVTRILASWYFLGQDDPNYPQVSFNAFNNDDPATNEHVDVQDDHWTVVRAIGTAGTALLKNNGALPLNKPKNIAIIGSDAADAAMGPNGYSDRGGDDGILAMGWGSGTANYPYLIAPVGAIQNRARQDGTSVNWWFQDFDTAGAQSAAFGYEVAIVFVNADSGEGYITVDGNTGDRNNLTLWHNADNLINAVAAINNNTVVVVHSVGACILEAWIENPNVTAVLWAGIAGQEAGNAITDVLYGAFNPSGRLPYTIARNASDYPAPLTTGGGPNDIISIPYSEGLFIDYRHFDALNITPRFEFGFGLSYTNFSYANLRSSKITQEDHDSTQLEQAWAAGQPTPNIEGGSTALWLHRPAFEVLFDLKNTGSIPGGEIAQLYLHSPDATEPPSLLRGFADVLLNPGETQTVRVTLSRYDLSVWDADAQGWRKPSGLFRFSVGASSRDFRLSGTLPT